MLRRWAGATEKFRKTLTKRDPTYVVPREDCLRFFFAAGFAPAHCTWQAKNADDGQKSRQFKHAIFPFIRLMIPLNR